MTRGSAVRGSVPGPSRLRVTLAVLAGTAALLGACSGDEEPTPTTTTSTTTAPATTAATGPPAGAVEKGLRDLETGDCFDRVADPTASDKVVWSVDCAVAHSHEVYEVIRYEGEGAPGGSPYPGVAVVQDWSEQACYERFEAFVGIRWTLSELDIELWWPSEESWGRGDRAVICTVFSPAGDRLVGSRRGTEA